MPSEQVLVAFISTVGGVIIAYIVNVLSKKEQARKAKREPKDRMEQMFDGYERLIKQKDLEDERKGRLIDTLERTVDSLEEELSTTRALLARTQEDLTQSKEETQYVRLLLESMRKEYRISKQNDKKEVETDGV